MKQLAIAVAAIAGAFAAQSATAQAAQGDFGGHHYAYYATIGDFAAAQAGATAAGGYLATVTSQGEQDFLHTLVSFQGSGITAYIGGTDEGHEGVWSWLGGPEAGQSFYNTDPMAATDLPYSFWNGDEPNNCCGGENALLINWDQQTGKWNDISAGAGYGYIVESAVPEPATWGLMMLGLGAVGGFARRRATKVAFAS